MAQFIWNKQNKKAIPRKDMEQMEQSIALNSSETKSVTKRRKTQKEETVEDVGE